jgi:hypothetical protein
MPALSGAGLADPYDITIVGAEMMGLYSGWRLLISGEAYSLDQGWVEGALRTVETVLTRYFQLPNLSGVQSEYIKRGKTDGQ